jgi:hypothetical protein
MLASDFYLSGNLSATLNETSIALVLRKINAINLQDFCPISMCNVVYKITTKSLANRLKSHLLNKFVDTHQAFIKGKRITNNVILG